MNGWDIVIWAVAGVLAAGVAWLAWEIRQAPLDPPGWGPGSDVPVPYSITRLPPRTARDDCGCLHFGGGYWSPCRIHDSGLIEAHLERWEDELSP